MRGLVVATKLAFARQPFHSSPIYYQMGLVVATRSVVVRALIRDLPLLSRWAWLLRLR